MNINQGFK
ncbi:hypothetical protein Zm00014a_039408 [Zea mays]|uniref:Uncharacterized protein n=1 Tax=Zea mays TaxID=4577 RepID=A0A3L6EWQ4_MAIZE|nr:hypothetical protein Zm00014a_039408 [Zea mays]